MHLMPMSLSSGKAAHAADSLKGINALDGVIALLWELTPAGAFA